MTAQTTLLKLKDKFGAAILQELPACKDITLEVAKENLKEILSYLKEAPEPGFEVLLDLTAVDYLTPKACTRVIYTLYNPVDYSCLCLFVSVERLSELPSVTEIWEGADWFEREVFDLFGLKFEGHPDLKRILMPDDWVGYPLLKDYALTEEAVQFKNNVVPKVPSNIIPHFRGNYND